MKQLLKFMMVALLFVMSSQSFAQSDDFVILQVKETYLGSKPKPVLIVIKPDNSIETIELETLSSDGESIGKNSLTLKKQIAKWREKGYTQMTMTSRGEMASYLTTIFLFKEEK